MLNNTKILNETQLSNKQDPSNVKNIQQEVHSCRYNLHDANDKDTMKSTVTLSSRPQSRQNSISSCQTEPNPVTSNQMGASNQRLQNFGVNQDNIALKNEIAELRSSIAKANT